MMVKENGQKISDLKCLFLSSFSAASSPLFSDNGSSDESTPNTVY